MAQSILFVGLVALLFFHVGRMWQAQFLERGLFMSEWLLLFAPALLFVLLFRFDAIQTLSLRLPRRKALLGGVLLMLGGTPLAWFVAWLQTFILPIPWDLVEGLAEMLTPESGRDLLWLFLLIAVTPAICEEAVFRGALMGGMRKLKPTTAILFNGLIFGLFHVSFESAFRLGPTAFIGTLMAIGVWYSRSIFVGSLMHFMNNGTIVLMVAFPAVAEFIGGSGTETRPPFVLLAPALILAAAGITLLVQSSREQDAPDPDLTSSVELQAEHT